MSCRFFSDVFVLLTRQEKLKRIRDVNRLLTKKSVSLSTQDIFFKLFLLGHVT